MSASPITTSAVLHPKGHVPSLLAPSIPLHTISGFKVYVGEEGLLEVWDEWKLLNSVLLTV